MSEEKSTSIIPPMIDPSRERAYVVDVFTGKRQHEAALPRVAATLKCDQMNRAFESTHATAGNRYVLSQAQMVPA